MKVPAHIFREYDIRGVVDVDLTEDLVEALGRGLGTVFAGHGHLRIGVGRDVRASGERLFDDLARGLQAAGCTVVDYGQVPTPTFYHAVRTGPEQSGVQITGSHNPPEFNGFKIVLGDESFFGQQIYDLAKRMQSEDFASGKGERQSRQVADAYVDDIAERIKLGRSPRFAYDSGNGAAALLVSRVFERLGLSPVALFDDPDGSFPNHHPDPTVPENLEDLRRAVLDQGLEFGVAYDGDADRIGVIDEKGQVLWGDRLLMLYARDLLTRQPGAKVLFDVKCSQTLMDDISAHGGEAIIWKTGHSLIKKKMKESGAPLAGEMSGHMFFAENYYGYDDAIFATLRLLEIVSRSDKPLSSLLADRPPLMATPEIRVDCPDDVKFDVVERVRDGFRGEGEIIDIDGVRVTFEHGWGLVRASNTQPALVVRAEASSEEHRDRYLQRIEAAIVDARQAVAAKD